MLDFSHLPDYGQTIFRFDSPCSTTEWITWQKPRGCKLIVIEMFGGGGAGGSATARGNGTTRGGAGGGGCGARSILIIPAFFLPDILYVQVGAGGVGQPGAVTPANGVNGTAGGITYVSIAPNNLSSNLVLLANGGAGGAGAPLGSNGLGGNAGAATVVTDCMMGYMGFLFSSVGPNSAAGGVQTGGSDVATLSISNALASGGGGGAAIGSSNTERLGGGITVPGGLSVLAVPVRQTGNPGYIRHNPLAVIGGGGGSSASAGAGGSGGNADMSCGGGGGAGGVTLGGAGGNGGSGLALIITF